MFKGVKGIICNLFKKYGYFGKFTYKKINIYTCK